MGGGECYGMVEGSFFMDIRGEQATVMDGRQKEVGKSGGSEERKWTENRIRETEQGKGRGMKKTIEESEKKESADKKRKRRNRNRGKKIANHQLKISFANSRGWNDDKIRTISKEDWDIIGLAEIAVRI